MINKIKMELEGKRIEDYDNILFQKINEFNILKSNLETTINNLKNNLKELNNKYRKDLNNLYNEKLNLMSNEVEHEKYINNCLCRNLNNSTTRSRDYNCPVNANCIAIIDYWSDYNHIYYFKCDECNKIFQSPPCFNGDDYICNAIKHTPPKKNI